MCKQFYIDLRKAHRAEDLVREQFSKLTDKYTFEDVANNPFYYHKGDIKAVAKDGKEVMIEVKDDSRIAETKNILCEEGNYFFDTGEMVDGNFYSDYEIYTIVSKSERKIYVLDFLKLKEIYKNYPITEIKHPQQISYVRLVPLSAARRNNALIEVVEY